MIERVAVIGAGTMGHGIAQVSAMAGLETVLWDPDPSALEKGVRQVGSNLDRGVEKGKVSEQTRARAMERLRAGGGLQDTAAADLVIEAIPERMELKQALFRELSGIVSDAAILGTNTSSLSVSEIASAASLPHRVVGLHFFNPVHLMRLLEIVRARETDERTVQASVEFARAVGKEPIVVTDTPGFASSRLGLALGLEAMRMVEQGVATPEDIDTAMVLGYNHPIGPLRLTDLVGLDIRLEIAKYLHATLGGEQFEPPAILYRMVEEGRLGRKSGRGFYEWESG